MISENTQSEQEQEQEKPVLTVEGFLKVLYWLVRMGNGVKIQKNILENSTPKDWQKQLEVDYIQAEDAYYLKIKRRKKGIIIPPKPKRIIIPN